jgi:hypothetical protein
MPSSCCAEGGACTHGAPPPTGPPLEPSAPLLEPKPPVEPNFPPSLEPKPLWCRPLGRGSSWGSTQLSPSAVEEESRARGGGGVGAGWERVPPAGRGSNKAQAVNGGVPRHTSIDCAAAQRRPCICPGGDRRQQKAVTPASRAGIAPRRQRSCAAWGCGCTAGACDGLNKVMPDTYRQPPKQKQTSHPASKRKHRHTYMRPTHPYPPPPSPRAHPPPLPTPTPPTQQRVGQLLRLQRQQHVQVLGGQPAQGGVVGWHVEDGRRVGGGGGGRQVVDERAEGGGVFRRRVRPGGGLWLPSLLLLALLLPVAPR